MSAPPLHRRAHSPAPLAPTPRAGRALLTLLGLFALGASETSRASDAARIEVQFVVPPLQRLRAETEVVSLPPVTTDDVLAGHIDLPRPVQLLLFSNCPWELRLRAAGQTRRSAADATIGPGLWWSLTGEDYRAAPADWTRLTGGPRVLGTRVELRVRIPLAWDQCDPGSYQQRLEYEIVAAGI